jgi:hypothetical protein
MLHHPARSTLFAALLLSCALPLAPVRAFQQPAPAPGAPAAPAAPVALTADAAKPLLGDWTIVVQGQQGPATINLTLKADAGKAVGEMSSDVMPATTVTDITKAGDVIVLRYSFDYQGNMVPTEVTMKPAGEALDVTFDFAGGAFIMAGTATRKKS